MSALTRKQSRFEGGRRPWNIATETAREDTARLGGTPFNEPEIQQCLNCSRPVQYCQGECKIKNPAFNRKPRKPMPEDFPAKYATVAYIRDLAAYYEVAEKTIYRWTRDAGLTRRDEKWKGRR